MSLITRCAQAGMLRVYHLCRGNMRFRGLPIMLLSTVGAKSNKPRQTLVCWFEDEQHPGAWLIVASAAGSARHPAWFHNLWKHPDRVTAHVRGRVARVQPELLSNDERNLVWPRIEANAEFRRFQQRTARTIPVVRLIPAS